MVRELFFTQNHTALIEQKGFFFCYKFIRNENAYICIEQSQQSSLLIKKKEKDWILDIYGAKVGDNQDYQKQHQDKGKDSIRIKTTDPRISKGSQSSKGA